MAAKKEVKVGVVGYGPAFSMGKHHLNAMAAHKGLVPCAVCDIKKDEIIFNIFFEGCSHYLFSFFASYL